MFKGCIVGNIFCKICIVFVCLALCKFRHVASQFALTIEDYSRTMCPTGNEICSDNSPHFLCTENFTIAKSCRNFAQIEMTNVIKKQLIDGHNGIRNKVADDFGIANMNLMYWSRELETVARNYLKQCKIKHDPCKYIGVNNLKVNTNILFRDRHLIDRWPSRAVRQWYLELGADIKTGREFTLKKIQDKTYAVNLTQMIWPQTEFLGCSAAKMFHGFFLVCYYFPPYESQLMDMHIFFGSGCSKCPRLRPSCSRIYNSLCGIDIKVDSAEALTSNKLFYTIIFVIFWTV